MGTIFKDLDLRVTVDAGLQVIGRNKGAHKELVCLRVTIKGLEGGRCQLGVYVRKRHISVPACQKGWHQGGMRRSLSRWLDGQMWIQCKRQN